MTTTSDTAYHNQQQQNNYNDTGVLYSDNKNKHSTDYTIKELERLN